MPLNLKYIIIREWRVVSQGHKGEITSTQFFSVKILQSHWSFSSNPIELKMLDDNAEFIVFNHTFDDCIIAYRKGFVVEQHTSRVYALEHNFTFDATMSLGCCSNIWMGYAMQIVSLNWISKKFAFNIQHVMEFPTMSGKKRIECRDMRCNVWF